MFVEDYLEALIASLHQQSLYQSFAETSHKMARQGLIMQEQVVNSELEISVIAIMLRITLREKDQGLIEIS